MIRDFIASSEQKEKEKLAMTLLFCVYESWFEISLAVKIPGWIEFVCIGTVNFRIVVHRPSLSR